MEISDFLSPGQVTNGDADTELAFLNLADIRERPIARFVNAKGSVLENFSLTMQDSVRHPPRRSADCVS